MHPQNELSDPSNRPIMHKDIEYRVQKSVIQTKISRQNSKIDSSIGGPIGKAI